jgi:chemotaxis protein CheC
MYKVNGVLDVKSERYSYQLAALSEMGNIAAAHAATALSKMLNERILIDVPESHLYRVEDLPQNLMNGDGRVAVVHIDIFEEQRGILLFIFPYDKALRLSRMFFNKNQNQGQEFKEDDKEAICEIGNICACAYLNAISKFLDITLIPNPPGLAVDIPEAIFEFPASLIGERSEYAVVIETKFIFKNEDFPGIILFILDSESQDLLFKKIDIITKPKVS